MPLDNALLARLEDPLAAADSATYFWRVAGCNMIADAGDIEAVLSRVNGGESGLDAERHSYSHAVLALTV